MIKLNALVSEDDITNLKVKRVKIKRGVKVNYKDLFKSLDALSQKEISFCYPYEDFLYFVGNEKETLKQLEKILEESIEEQSIDLVSRTNRNIYSYIFARAFVNKLMKIGYFPLKNVHHRKALVPKENFGGLKLIEPLDGNNNFYVYRGIKFGTRFLEDKKMLLFLDLYTPLVYKIGTYLRLVFIRNFNLENSIYKSYRAKAIMSPKNRYSLLEQIVNILKEGNEKVTVNFSSNESISFLPEFISLNDQNNYFDVNFVPEPPLEFRNGQSRNPLYGLSTFKPYSYLEDFQVTPFLIVDKRIDNNKVRKLIDYLKDGCNDRYGKFVGYSKLFGSSLQIQGENIKYIPINGFDDIKDEIEKIPDTLKNLVIMVIVRDEIAPKGTYKGTDFYKKMKSYCIEQQKRCQIITESTLNKLDEDGKSFVIYNLATAIYTKSGGTPWKIRDMDAAPPGTIFVGIAFTIDHQKKEINAGSLYFYDRLGKYLSFELTKYILPTTKGLYIPYKNMKELLEKLRGKFNWARYLIFHKTTPYHTEEVKAVSESLGKDVDYALIYLKAKHPMRFFKNDVNNFCNTRGEYITLKNAYEKSFVIYTTGNWYDGVKLRERPESFGTPKPIEVMVVENNIKKLGIEEIAKQIILLTKLDWNTCVIGVKEPITTKYSRKAASLLPMFKDTQKYSINDIRDLI
ncbi:MAG: hypothetical protein ACP5F8_03270 [Candidatus Aenigmatarchaeota archaeon]